MKSSFLKRFLEETITESLAASKVTVELYSNDTPKQEHARMGYNITICTSMDFLYMEEAIILLRALFNVGPEYITRVGVAVGTHAGSPSSGKWDFEISFKLRS